MTNLTDDDDSETLKPKKARRILGIGRDAMREALKSGAIPSIDINGTGKNRRITKATMKRLLENS